MEDGRLLLTSFAKLKVARLYVSDRQQYGLHASRHVVCTSLLPLVQTIQFIATSRSGEPSGLLVDLEISFGINKFTSQKRVRSSVSRERTKKAYLDCLPGVPKMQNASAARRLLLCCYSEPPVIDVAHPEYRRSAVH